jgi:hypothetical protein
MPVGDRYLLITAGQRVGWIDHRGFVMESKHASSLDPAIAKQIRGDRETDSSDRETDPEHRVTDLAPTDGGGWSLGVRVDHMSTFSPSLIPPRAGARFASTASGKPVYRTGKRAKRS